jgi:hypothetical protein
VPQLGDAVVYLWEGHQKYLDARSDVLTQRPWEVLKKGGPALQQMQQQMRGQVYLQDQQQQQQDWQQGSAFVGSYYAGWEHLQQQQSQPGLEQLHQQFAQLHQQQQQLQQQFAELQQHEQQQSMQQQSQLVDAAAAAAAEVPLAELSSQQQQQAAQQQQQQQQQSQLADAAAAAAADVPLAELSSQQQQATPPLQQQQHPGQLVDAAATAAAEVAPAKVSRQQQQMLEEQQQNGLTAAAGGGVAYQLRPAEPCTVVGLEYRVQGALSCRFCFLGLACSCVAVLQMLLCACECMRMCSQNLGYGILGWFGLFVDNAWRSEEGSLSYIHSGGPGVQDTRRAELHALLCFCFALLCFFSSCRVAQCRSYCARECLRMRLQNFGWVSAVCWQCMA